MKKTNSYAEIVLVLTIALEQISTCSNHYEVGSVCSSVPHCCPTAKTALKCAWIDVEDGGGGVFMALELMVCYSLLFSNYFSSLILFVSRYDHYFTFVSFFLI